jgi:predicted HicB family RNase H-like nuclease
VTTKKQRVVGTSRGTPLTGDDIQRLADQAEAGYDPSQLRPRGGRPRMGSAPAEVVPVRLDPELRAAVEARATADQTSMSEIIREALRRFLEVA